ncbi:NAD(P)H-binding protein [Kutzneria sp. CA-103260]|uniref:NAD(P)H-binding protein n=1 Tax=Kutzneria sp. CA-103260 TaxID=2802641 RepID=UPI001BA73C07|nr:NAD(P)H-binding protein [Kutzneria sp. CA-103260]QUQ64765.1 nucleotide-diphosphate-sugar epimerase/NmrA family protein [Kutzneria sp. CA-103260]
MILVTGATGEIGRAVVDSLLAQDIPVRATSRDPSRARLPDGVDVVRADLGDAAAVAAAVSGVDGVFLLTGGPEIPLHDKTVATAAASAGVRRIVKLSSGRAGDDTATDPIPRWHRAGERAVRESGVPWIMVRPMGFMSNALMWAGSIRAQDAVFAPYADGRVAVIDPLDIAAVAAVALTSAATGQVLTLSGPQALSPGEQVETLASVLGRPLRFVEVTPAAARDAIISHGVSPSMADAIMALRATALEEFTSVVHPTVGRVTGRPAGTFHAWAIRNLAAFG